MKLFYPPHLTYFKVQAYNHLLFNGEDIETNPNGKYFSNIQKEDLKKAYSENVQLCTRLFGSQLGDDSAIYIVILSIISIFSILANVLFDEFLIISFPIMVMSIYLNSIFIEAYLYRFSKIQKRNAGMLNKKLKQ